MKYDVKLCKQVVPINVPQIPHFDYSVPYPKIFNKCALSKNIQQSGSVSQHSTIYEQHFGHQGGQNS